VYIGVDLMFVFDVQRWKSF